MFSKYFREKAGITMMISTLTKYKQFKFDLVPCRLLRILALLKTVKAIYAEKCTNLMHQAVLENLGNTNKDTPF